MSTDTIQLERFLPVHVEGALALSRQAKWPHRDADWQLALALSQGIVAIESGRVVGTILMTPYGEDCATINMVIVDEAMRGRGLGRRLMDAALALGGARPLRLIATSDGLPLYRKLGFVEQGEIVQHQGEIGTMFSGATADMATPGDMPAIRALDREAFGADRTSLLDALVGIASFAVIRRDGRVEAYAALRAFGRGHVVGPVVAGNADDAKTLVAGLAARLLKNAFLRVDTPENSGLGNWLAAKGLAHVGGGIVMHRPAAPQQEARTARIYALANQALG